MKFRPDKGGLIRALIPSKVLKCPLPATIKPVARSTPQLLALENCEAAYQTSTVLNLKVKTYVRQSTRSTVDTEVEVLLQELVTLES